MSSFILPDFTITVSTHLRSLDQCANITTARYWKDPHAFRPHRFMEDWPRDAFLPFSGGKLDFPLCGLLCLKKAEIGARSCIGRRLVSHMTDVLAESLY